jgi:hypothetical protein
VSTVTLLFTITIFAIAVTTFIPNAFLLSFDSDLSTLEDDFYVNIMYIFATALTPIMIGFILTGGYPTVAEYL